jgi:putative phosphoesterase
MNRAPEVRVVRRTLAMQENAIRLAVVADTHGRPHPDATARIEAERPDAILHAGDIGDVIVLEPLARIAPLIAVRGNIDPPGLPDAITIDVMDGDAARLRIFLFHIALAGTRLRADAARLSRAEGAGLVVCGHSHVPFIGRDRRELVFNPGSIGPRRFQLPIVFGVLELDDRGLSMRHIDCVTGERWLP